MEIVNFFEKLAGRWFSQRTTHALSTQQSKAGKSDLEVEFLPPETAEVQQLYQPNAAEGAQPICGLRIHQSSTLDGDTKPTVRSTLLVALALEGAADEQSAVSGKLLSSGTQNASTYTFQDEVLTIVSEGPEARSEERMWFINDNLRMRTGFTQMADGLRIASFCSEIRRGAKPPEQ